MQKVFDFGRSLKISSWLRSSNGVVWCRDRLSVSDSGGCNGLMLLFNEIAKVLYLVLVQKTNFVDGV